MADSVGGKLKYIITADADDLYKTINKVDKAMDDLGAEGAESGAEAGKGISKGVSEGASEATQAVGKFASQSKSTLSEFASAAGSIVSGAFKTISAGMTTGLMSLVSGGISDTQFLEETNIQMMGLTHSVEKGNQAMAAAVQYYKNNPFTRFDVTAATKSLLQFGAATEEIPQLLDKMGKVSLSTGVNINELATLYQKASADGRVGLVDIQMLAERGVPIWDAFSKAVGKSSAQIREETAKGGVAVEDFHKAFEFLVDDKAMEQFNNTLSRQMDRFSGRLSNMKAAIAGYSTDVQKGLTITEGGLYRSVTNLYKSFADAFDKGLGTRIYGALEKIGNAIAPLINSLAKALPGLLEKFAGFLEYIADNSGLLIPILGGALTFFGGLANKIPIVGELLGGVSGKLQGILKIFKGLGAIKQIAVVTIIAGLFGALKDPAGQEALKSIISSLGKIAQALAPVIAQLAKLAVNIGSTVMIPVLQAFAKVLELLANIISAIPTPVLTSLIVAITGFIAAKKAVGPIKEIAGGLGSLLTGLKDIKKAGLGIAGTMRAGGNFITGVLGQLFGGKKDSNPITATKEALSVTKQTSSNAQGTLSKLITLAGVVVAFALAIKTVDTSVPNDMSKLIPKLGLLAGVIGAMGLISKAAEKVKLNRASITNLTLLAAPIAAFAVTLLAVNKFIPNNLDNLMTKLGLLAGVIVAMGGLAWAFSKLGDVRGMTRNIINLTLLALPLVAFAGAIKLIDMALPANVGKLVAKLGVIGGVIAAMEVLCGIAGKFGDAQKKGLLVIAGIAGDIALVALALKAVDILIPENFGNFALKLANMGIAIGGMITFAGIAGALKSQEFAGLLIIAGIAADIALVALALKVADLMIPDDFGTFALKLANMGIAILGMGVLAGIAGSLAVTELLGLVVIAGIAADIALVGIALGIADKSIQSDFGTLVGKIGAMGLAITEFGVLAGILGAVMATGIGALLLGAGLVAILGICGGIAAVGTTLGYIDQQVPDDTAAIVNKIKGMGECMSAMSDAAFGNVLKNFLGVVNIALVSEIANIYTHIADNLTYISKIELDTETIKHKITTIKDCMAVVSANDDRSVFDLFKGVIKEFLNTVDVAQASQTLDIYKYIAETLNRIQEIPINYDTIKAKIELLKSVVDLVANTGEDGIGGMIVSACSAFLEKVKTDQVRQVLGVYTEMTEDLMKIQDIKVSKEELEPKIQVLKDVVDLVTDTKEKSLFAMIGNAIKNKLVVEATQNAQTIFSAYSVIADAIDNIKNKIPADMSEVNTRITNLKNLVTDLQQFPTVDGIDEKRSTAENAATLIEKLANIGNSLKSIPESLPEGITSKLSTIISCIEEAGKVKQQQNLQAKEKILDQSQSIINKMTEIGKTLVQFKDLELGDAQSKIVSIRDIIYEAGSINQNAGKKNQEEIVGRTQSIINKMLEMGRTLVEINGLELGDAKQRVIDIRDIIYEAGSINQNSGNKKQEEIVERTKSIIYKYEEIAKVLVNLNAMELGDAKQKIIDIRDICYQAGQVNQNSANEKQVQIIERTKAIVEKYKEIAGVIQNIPQIQWDWQGNNVSTVRDICKVVAEGLKESMATEEHIQTLDRVISIVRKYKEIAQVLTEIPMVHWDPHGDIVKNVRDIAQTAGDFNVGYATPEHEEAVSRAQSIVNKLREIAGVLVTFPEADYVAIKNDKVDRIKDIVNSLVDLNIIPDMDSRLETVNKATEVARALSRFAEAVNGITPLAENVKANISALAGIIANEIQSIITTLVGYNESFRSIGAEYAQSLVAGFQSVDMRTPAETQVRMAEEAARNIISKFEPIGRDYMTRVRAGINSINLYWDAYRIGENAANGLRNGMTSKLGEVSRAATLLGQQVTRAIMSKKALDEASPSKAMFHIGDFATEGLINGLLDQKRQLQRAAQTLADTVRDPFDELDASLNINGRDAEKINTTGMSKNITINQNNNINNGMDYSTMMAGLRWELFRA